MKAKKVFLPFFMVCCLLMSMFIVVGLCQQAQATSREVTFILHKRVYQDINKIPMIDQNINLSENSPQLKYSKGISGAVYTVYNVTSDYWQLAAEGRTNEEIVMSLKANSTSVMTDAKKVAEVVSRNDPTFGEGVASVSLPELVRVGEEEKYAVYLFNEKSSPIIGEQGKTGVLVVSLPITEIGESQSYIHLYPKSSINNQVSLTKKLNEKRQNFSYGEPIEYVIEATVPNNLLYLKKYKLQDSYDLPLNYVKGSLRVYIEGVEKKDIFTFIEDFKNHKLSLEAKGSLLKAKGIVPGAKVKVVYQMLLSEMAEPGIPYNNAVQLTTLFEGSQLPELVSESLPVETGGKKFRKVDMENQNQTLANATFLVKNTAAEYLVEKDGSFVWSDQRSEAFQLISDSEGGFEIKGLAYGTYKLEEIKAPTGYTKLAEEIPFTITEGSYQLGNQPASPLIIVNSKKAVEEPNKPIKKFEGSIPRMGEITSMGIITIGSMILFITGLYLLRRKQK